MGGGKRRPHNKNNSRKASNNNSLFVEGGILAGFDTPPPPLKKNNSHQRGQKKNSSGSRSRNNNNNGGGSSSNANASLVPKGKAVPLKKSNPNPNAFHYQYPSLNFQDVMRSESLLSDKDDNANVSNPIILLGNKSSNIVVYEDSKPSMEAPKVAYQYEYNSDFVLGESSHNALGYSEDPDLVDEEEEEEMHRGLGFSDKLEAEASGGVVLSTKSVIEAEEPGCNDMDEDTDEGSMDDGSEQEFLDETSSPKKNSAFVSIGGVRLYTQDISDGESEDEDEELSEEGSSSETSDSDDSTSDFGSDGVDEDVMQDYLEGIGGSGQLLDSKWLALQDLDNYAEVDGSDDDSSDEYGDTLDKLSGFALQEASRQYGAQKKQSVQKRQSKKKSFSGADKSKSAVDWSPSVDDIMFVKDPRRLSGKKKHTAGLPQSWPSEGRKNKKFGRYPGEKKKHRKEMIAVKRRERMLNRGVDLEEINLKLKQMVMNQEDVLAFQPMHQRDCAQVQRLAAIYRLRSGSQAFGKKKFVIVSRTPHTSMPSASDAIRLEKLIGGSKDDGDFPVVDKPRKTGYGSAPSKSAKSSADRQGSSGRRGGRSSGQKPAAYANQPVSFVSSGVMQSDTKVTVESSQDNTNLENKAIASVSSTFGSFEVHTTGFGSKMMSKMGYVEGEGLGKDGKGMSKPIEAVQRPKSLGLGMAFDETSSEPASAPRSAPAKRSGSSSKKNNHIPNIGAFEKHTKGFGSKMMAQMGFIEGAGLGRNSQGISTPLFAVRRPKARGLGAEGRS